MAEHIPSAHFGGMEPDERLHKEFLWGGVFSPDDVADFQRRLEADDHDVQARLALIAHYGYSARASADAAAAVVPHILWLIQEDPRLASVRSAFGFSFIVLMKGEGVSAAVHDAWLEQVQRNPADVAVLLNAAQVLQFNDRNAACELAERAYSLEMNVEQTETLAGVFRILSYDVRRPNRRHLLARAFDLFERSLGGRTSADIVAIMPPEVRADPSEVAMIPALLDMYRMHNLEALAAIAMDLEFLDKAEAFGNELLATIARWQASSGCEHDATAFDEAYHHGHVVLGRVALRRGDVEAAKRHLLAAGHVSGSPSLGSFGPNMALAKELLDVGQADVVLEYFDLCAKFWERHEHILDDWRNAVRSGQIPDFGANMVY